MRQLALDLGNPVFIKGFLAFATMFVVFIGSTWLLLSMILGVKLGYLVTGACFFSVMILLSAIWFLTGLGPKGPDGFIGQLGIETGWEPVAAGPDLSSVKSEFGDFDVSDYPGAGWVEPAPNKYLADLTGDDSTANEMDNAKPVMDSLILAANSPIPGKRKEVADHVKGRITLEAGKFHTTDIRMKETKVVGKDSVIAVGRSVPSDVLTAGAFGADKEGKVSEYIADVGDVLNAGTPVMEVTTASGTVQLKADRPGRLILFGFKVGDKIKPNVPFATVDISGQPGAQAPVQVIAVRVRGSVKMPAFVYLVSSSVLFVLHLLGLSRMEKRQKIIAQPATT
ncbi:MAG: hypothetical protein ACR2M4_03885 [Actinomycetota bacterium]